MVNISLERWTGQSEGRRYRVWMGRAAVLLHRLARLDSTGSASASATTSLTSDAAPSPAQPQISCGVGTTRKSVGCSLFLSFKLNFPNRRHCSDTPSCNCTRNYELFTCVNAA